jgi:hypothetical protein
MTEPKPPPKADDKEQSKRFIEKAREIEADETGEAFERAIKKIVPRTPGPPREDGDSSGA